MFARPSVLRNLALPSLAVLIVGGWAYFGALSGPFVFDDIRNVRDNDSLRIDTLSWDSLSAVVEANLAQARPVAMLSFALNFYFGGEGIGSFHLTNVAIHLVNGVLVFLLAQVTLALAQRETGSAAAGQERAVLFASLFAACLFVAHPVQTQAVTYIVQRMASLATLFFLSALISYIAGRRTSRPSRRLFFWSIAALAWMAALGCKQIAVTLPLVVLLYEWFFFRDADLSWLRRGGVYWGLGLLAVVLVGTAYMWGRIDEELIFPGYAHRDYGMTERVLTQFRVVVFYLSLVALPLPSRLNLLHAFSTSTSLLSPWSTLLSLLLLLATLALAGYLVRRNRLLSFGILWFFLNLLLESSIVPLEVVYEHRLYLPLVGVALIAAELFRIVCMRRMAPAVVVGTLLVLLLAEGARRRNVVWQDAVVLWSDVIAKNETAHRAYTNRGRIHEERGDFARAEDDLTHAIELAPHKPNPYNNRGKVKQRMGDYRAALQDFDKALELDRNLVTAYYNRGRAHLELSNLDFALRDLSTYIENAPPRADAHHFRGLVHHRLENHALALTDYARALEMAPGAAATYRLRGDTHRRLRQFDKAEADYDRAIELKPDYVDAYLARANLKLTLGKLQDAIEDYGRAIELRPESPDMYQTYGNRGTAAMLLGRYADALTDYERMIGLQPDEPAGYNNAAWLLATCPLAEHRDGAKALAYVDRIRELGAFGDAGKLDTMAAVLAELGRFDEAIEWQKRAVEMVPENNQADLRKRLELYRQRTPYRQSVEPIGDLESRTPAMSGRRRITASFPFSQDFAHVLSG